MNTTLCRSLLFLLSFVCTYSSEKKLPPLFAFDQNFSEKQAKESEGVYRLDTVYVIGESYQFTIAFERDMKRILRQPTSSARPILERVTFSPEDRSDMPAYLRNERPGPFVNERDAMRFQDGFVINLPGGQKMNATFKSFISFKVGNGTLELRPSRNQLIRYKLKW